MRLTALIVGAASLALGGCASIVSGHTQSVSVDTVDTVGQVSGAKCELTNNKGTWFVTSPGTTLVHRSFEDLAIRCESEKHEPGLANVKSTTKGMAFGNILFGGIIGAGIDVSTGAAYDYPTLITVQMGASRQGGAQPPSTPTTAQMVLKPGDRLVYAERDARNGVTSGEVVHTLSAVDDGAMVFNDGAVIIKNNGLPSKGSLAASYIYWTGTLPVRGTWPGKFRAENVWEDVPVEISVVGPETKTISGRSFSARKLKVSGYASRQLISGMVSSAEMGAPFEGTALVDAATGLVLELKVTSRHPLYAVDRQLVRLTD